MFKHDLVEASDSIELQRKLSVQSGLKILKTKPFTTRESALNYLQYRFSLLKKYPVIAVPVQLPTTPEYRAQLDELRRLKQLLKQAVRPWARSRLEEKVVEQNNTLRYMEEHAKTGTLHWSVYRAEENQNGQHFSNLSQLQ